jgi:hypothetical protein
MSLLDRARRMPLHLLVEVRGEDAAGTRFTEKTRTLNVSGGGICFESRRRLPIGARVRLSIELPARLRRHFGNQAVYRARAVICRVERARGAFPARVGARFLREEAAEEVV